MTRNITTAIESDMLIAVDIADMYVTNEIEILKIRAAETAREIDQMISAGETNILERVNLESSRYVGLAVFDNDGLLDSCGIFSVPEDLHKEPFMRIAENGGQAVSTTMYAPDESLVMYVSAPMKGGKVLAAVLPGLHFSEVISEFTFWESGHFFIDDKDGYIISNYRREWVQTRLNYIEMEKTDKAYEEIAGVIKRGVKGERGVGRFSIAGVPRICAFRPITSPTEDWFIGIVAPISESALHKIPQFILIIGIIVMVLSLIAAIIASYFLKQPYLEADRLRKMAESASVSKSTFLANMSHEIRTPMNSVLGFAELALDGEIPAKTKDYLKKIMTNAEWLLQIINDILDISKIESGKMELEKIPFDMHDLFTSCRTLVMPKAVEKGIMLHFYAEPSIKKKPLGDPTRLRQVFVNLLSNAVKFTQTGIVKILADIKEVSNNTTTIYFEIKDSGIGMTSEQIERIFIPFSQAESGTTRKYGGTGLGLSITKNIVEMMGGKLVVESTPGVGTKFSFTLVFDTVDITENEKINKHIVLKEIEKPMFEGEVLLCEDNAMNQQVICEHLARVGLKTVVAENGKIGLDLVISRMEKDKKQFDLIFMDMHMPVMDGLEASKKINELKQGVPIVAMTANIMSNDLEIYKISGMNDYVGKPFTSQELWRCLMNYFTPVSIGSTDANNVKTDTEFQKNLQLYFLKSNRTKYSEIKKALDANDIKLAHRLAHTLKSNAGQIGKTILQKVAADVELQLANGKNFATAEKLKVLENELDMVLNELSSLLIGAEKKQTGDIPALELEKARELLEKLEPLIRSGNPECLEYEDDLLGIPGSEKLIKQIDDFEFTDAFVTLVELKERMGIK